MCPFWFWRIMSSTNQRQNWFGNLPPDFFAVGTLTPCPSSSLAAESMAQGEHKLAPYSKMARNTVNKESVNQPLGEAEGYEYTDRYKTSYWDFYQFFSSASMIKNYFDFRVLLFPPPHSPTETDNSKNASCFSCFFNKYLKVCSSPSKKAGNAVWSEQDWTKHEFHMDELLIISSYYLVHCVLCISSGLDYKTWSKLFWMLMPIWALRKS